MATRVTDGARWERLPPSFRASRGFALQDLKKKRDCSQCTRMAWLPRNSSIHAPCNNLICCKRGLIRGWWNGQHSFLTRFATMLQNKLDVFFAEYFLWNIKIKKNLGDLLYLLNDAGEKNWWLISEESNTTLHLSIREDKTYKVQRTVSTNQQTFYHSIISWCRLQPDWVCHQDLLSLVVAFTCLSGSSLFRDV